ncbi:GCD complex subunit gcd7 [Coemansia aciculifera]|uniref:Translation initiation factor eIF2B subunit beta n=2 Tax=Coemansia TaxID=4863 RepID=A0A9W8L8G7_9FUNG|nr:GCD complex subunit gcd7 [Coemansia pectinata]KAJ2859280.1 GCD complex subunit gcd7 [Coemansia aciculifera]KAJ2869443.1 GCD complex subunit gcd7 [Coemansia aciculifera]KAJ2880690.1 GCD complex subunit gcd7 [Coemansia aciculifera]
MSSTKMDVFSTRELPLLIESFVSQLKRGQLVGSKTVAMNTANLLREIVSRSPWEDIPSLTTLLKAVGKRLLRAQPRELIIFNVVCRVLHIVNEDYSSVEVVNEEGPMSKKKGSASGASSASKGSETPAMGLGQPGTGQPRNLGEQVSQSMDRATLNAFHLKSLLIQEIMDYILELEKTEVEIADNAREHIHSNEIILTCGRSLTVEKFLKNAASKVKIHVIVAECAPTYDGHEQAQALASANIDVVVIPDAAVFAIMSRVNKVILGAHAVLANGGLVAASGSHTIAAAARHHSTQVVVCAGLYKYSPMFPFDDDRFNTLVSPDAVLPYGDGELIDTVDVSNPRYDYVPPELVDILVDHTGGHLPSYLYRLLQENYAQAKDLAWNIQDE